MFMISLCWHTTIMETIIAGGWYINSRTSCETPTCQHVLARYKHFMGQYYSEKLKWTWSFHACYFLDKIQQAMNLSQLFKSPFDQTILCEKV